MITSASVSGNKLSFRDEGVPNIFPITSASLIIGGQGVGKTLFLKSVIDRVLDRSGDMPSADLSFTSDYQFDSCEWGVVFYSSCRYSEPLPINSNLVERFCASYDVDDVFKNHSEFLGVIGVDLTKGYQQLSSGEKHIIDVFASIKTSVEALSEKSHVLVVLDNPDAGLHPRMQRAFVYNVTRFLADLQTQYGLKGMQLIMTTNSPLVIGDFPRNYVLQILEEGQKNDRDFATFSADLGSIYNLAMKCQTIPELASRTINDTVANIKNNTVSELDNYVISNLGNPIIKRELERLKSLN